MGGGGWGLLGWGKGLARGGRDLLGGGGACWDVEGVDGRGGGEGGRGLLEEGGTCWEGEGLVGRGRSLLGRGMVFLHHLLNQPSKAGESGWSFFLMSFIRCEWSLFV